jgi:hypothetical protein
VDQKRSGGITDLPQSWRAGNRKLRTPFADREQKLQHLAHPQLRHERSGHTSQEHGLDKGSLSAGVGMNVPRWEGDLFSSRSLPS